MLADSTTRWYIREWQPTSILTELNVE